MQTDPKQFAEWCKATHFKRETSWDNHHLQYNMEWYTAALAADVPEPWAKIISVLLFPGYADIWDWCEEQGVKLD